MDDEIKKIGDVVLGPGITNPFTRDSIISVYVSMMRLDRRGRKDDWLHYGIVKFKKGNTTGEQRFDGDSFDDVTLKIKNFINNEL